MTGLTQFCLCECRRLVEGEAPLRFTAALLLPK